MDRKFDKIGNVLICSSLLCYCYTLMKVHLKLSTALAIPKLKMKDKLDEKKFEEIRSLSYKENIKCLKNAFLDYNYYISRNNIKSRVRHIRKAMKEKNN
jgi:hypothetical protein